MNEKCDYCVYRDKSWKQDQNEYGCEAVELGLCGEPKMEQRKVRRLENKCLLCAHCAGYAVSGLYGCEDPDCGSPGFVEFKAYIPEGCGIKFESTEGVIWGTVSGIVDMDTDPKYVVDTDHDGVWYVLADNKTIERV